MINKNILAVSIMVLTIISGVLSIGVKDAMEDEKGNIWVEEVKHDGHIYLTYSNRPSSLEHSASCTHYKCMKR